MRRLAGVLDDRQAVLAEERELEVVPLLREQRAVPAQVAAPGRLPADLVVVQEVRQIRRDGGEADSRRPAGSRATRSRTPCGRESNLYETLTLPIVVLLVHTPLQIRAGRVPVLLTNGTQLDVSPRASPAMKLHKRLAALAAAAEPVAEAEEALQRVLGLKKRTPPVTLSLSVMSKVSSPKIA